MKIMFDPRLLILTNNTRMLKVCEELGFAIKHLSDGLSRVDLVLK